MTGRQVVGTGILILFATAVFPPAAAWAVNRRRVTRALDEVSALAERLSARRAQLLRLPADIEVLSGPGRMPAADLPEVQRWVGAPRAGLAAVLGDAQPPADPWGNCYVIDLTGSRGDRLAILWVLSAGPNGIIDTPFGTPTPALAGDDVGAAIR